MACLSFNILFYYVPSIFIFLYGQEIEDSWPYSISYSFVSAYLQLPCTTGL